MYFFLLLPHSYHYYNFNYFSVLTFWSMMNTDLPNCFIEQVVMCVFVAVKHRTLTSS